MSENEKDLEEELNQQECGKEQGNICKECNGTGKDTYCNGTIKPDTICRICGGTG